MAEIEALLSRTDGLIVASALSEKDQVLSSAIERQRQDCFD
jgi:hypothetical protein